MHTLINKLVLVFKTHFDIGFTDLASNVIQQYATSMLDQVIETCHATEHMGNQKYIWTILRTIAGRNPQMQSEN